MLALLGSLAELEDYSIRPREFFLSVYLLLFLGLYPVHVKFTLTFDLIAYIAASKKINLLC